MYDARNLTAYTTDVAVPKSPLVLLFGVDMPKANAQKSSWSTPITGHGTSTYKIPFFEESYKRSTTYFRSNTIVQQLRNTILQGTVFNLREPMGLMANPVICLSTR